MTTSTFQMEKYVEVGVKRLMENITKMYLIKLHGQQNTIVALFISFCHSVQIKIIIPLHKRALICYLLPEFFHLFNMIVETNYICNRIEHLLMERLVRLNGPNRC